MLKVRLSFFGDSVYSIGLWICGALAIMLRKKKKTVCIHFRLFLQMIVQFHQLHPLSPSPSNQRRRKKLRPLQRTNQEPGLNHRRARGGEESGRGFWRAKYLWTKKAVWVSRESQKYFLSVIKLATMMTFFLRQKRFFWLYLLCWKFPFK